MRKIKREPGASKVGAQKRALSAREKGHAVAELATWLADLDEIPPRAAQSIDRAYQALQVVRLSAMQCTVCALLASAVSGTDADKREHVRRALRSLNEGPEFASNVNLREPSDAALDAAISAWARRHGEHGASKWEATARVVNAVGLGPIESDGVALKKTWERFRREGGSLLK